MAFDLDALRTAVARHGRVTRVVIAATHGSAPREVGAAMLVWDGGQSGTIGGGALEFELAKAALAQSAARRLTRHALGPELGQCCGGAVEVLSEVYDAAATASLGQATAFARPVSNTGKPPLAVRRALALARSQGISPAPRLLDGWMIEPLAPSASQLWVWGAGHVGRAIVTTLAPLPVYEITWIDTAPERFPRVLPDGATALPAQNPGLAVPCAPTDAHHLIVTYAHSLDLDICHRLLCHSFASAGLIGSATKWARFRKRLSALGHTAEQIARIHCPIGDPSLGKHPQAIAVGVASALLKEKTGKQGQWGETA